MEKNVKNTKIIESNKEMKKQAIKNVPDMKTEVKKTDLQKETKNQKVTSKIKKIFQQKTGKIH
jgi:hypothetical protein